MAFSKYDLQHILDEIGDITVPSIKSEVSFSYDEAAQRLWVTTRDHNPDGSYGTPVNFKFALASD